MLTFKHLQTITFFGFLLVTAFLLFQMINPFLVPLVWGVILATLFFPFYTFLLKKTKNKNISAILSVLVGVLVVIIPLSGVLWIIVGQASALYASLNDPENLEQISLFLANVFQIPIISSFLEEVNIEEVFKETARSIASFSFNLIQAYSRSAVVLAFSVFVTLYSMFYFLKDGQHILKRVMEMLPLSNKNTAKLYKKFTGTSKATLKGTFLIGIIQGSIGGILFFIAGIPSAAFWGLLMIILSIIPAVGASLVWMPAVIYLFVLGSIAPALFLLFSGTALSFLDNILRPPLVGNELQMHPIVIFFSTIGGLVVFGFSGIVLGPLIAAFFIAILEIYQNMYNQELAGDK